MSEVMTTSGPAVATGRCCRIEEVFDEGFIELLRLVPRNPYVRALILKLTSKMPGPACGTFEEIKEWVETCCERRTSFQRGSRHEDGIEVTVEFSDIEYGRADYSVSRTGRDQFHISAENLLRMVQDAVANGDGLDEIVETIAQEIDDDAWGQCEPGMEDSGDYDYTDHEASDSDSERTSYSKNEIRQAVLAFLRERHPNLAAEL